MQGLYAILLLIVSNVFMTFAWYGHLKLQEMKWIDNWPLFGVILFSWSIALFEYCAQVPANRLGFIGNGYEELKMTDLAADTRRIIEMNKDKVRKHEFSH